MTKTYLKNLQIRKAPRLVEKVVHALINIRPDLSEELLQCVDIPLKVKADTISGGEFIICDFNRDGDSYRSPQSNEYFPPPTDFKPFAISERMRSMEKAANQLFDVYRKLYFF